MFLYIQCNENLINLHRHMCHLLNRRQGFKQYTEFLLTVLKVKVMINTYCRESTRTLAIPLMCYTSKHLGIAVASRLHVLHFWLSVCPVKILSNRLQSKHTRKSAFWKQKEYFLMNIKTLKHSFVITGHLHWLWLKLPEM